MGSSSLALRGLDSRLALGARHGSTGEMGGSTGEMGGSTGEMGGSTGEIRDSSAGGSVRRYWC
ncbi:hypothetical protein ABLE92_14625 [Gordonia sp. VNQ95]|uniref:hypothetical protein n=1 Tax=Gordonia TaxID=2053 RepID=UPI0032B4CA6D